MTGTGTAQADLDAAKLLLDRMGISAHDLLAPAAPARQRPTFAQYIPTVAASVSAGTRRVYGSYWNKILTQWGDRRLDEITPSDVRALREHVKTHVVARRNARGGRSAAEHLIAALRCLFHHAIADQHLTANPALHIPKPRRLPSTRTALSAHQLQPSTTSPPPPATTRPWTPCSCACTARPPAAAAARSTCAPTDRPTRSGTGLP